MSFILPIVLVTLGIAFAFWIYFRRELPVRGRGLLATVRAAVLALLLLLLWNPSVPGGNLADDSGTGMILLDGSLSMIARDTSGAQVWDVALDRLRSMESESDASMPARLLLFGEELRSIEEATPAALGSRLEDETPDFTASELAPALERAVEAGARSVTIISDLRLEDATAAGDLARRLGLALRFEQVGEEIRNAGIATFDLPTGVEAGDSVPAEIVIFGEAPEAPEAGEAGESAEAVEPDETSENVEPVEAADSIALEIREGDRLVATRTVPLSGAGRMNRLSLSLPTPRGSGVVEYRARVQLEGDGFPLDDERIAHVTVDPEEGGIVLLSWRPDWEPRFLLPVLERVTGLAGYGFLRTGDGRYLSMGAGPSAGGTVEEDALRRRMARADLLVLHGIDGSAPAWVREAAESSERLLLFPLDPQGAGSGGITTGSARTGEWYAGSDIPASPLAAALSGMELTALPPLSHLIPMAEGEDGIVPLRLHLEGRGEGEAALVLRAEGARRRAVVLASGFWRWGFREGPGRQSYRRLWAGVSGWLLGNEPLAGGPGVRPQSSILPRGLDIPWRAPGMDGEALAVRVLQEDSVVVDSVLRVGEDATFHTPSLLPGGYRYIVWGEGSGGEAPGAEGTPEVGNGIFEVEAYSDELASGPREPVGTLWAGVDRDAGEEAGVPGSDPTSEDADEDEVEAGAEGGLDREFERPTRPLRTHPAPFLLLLALLCGEWIGRRGKGLR